MQNKENDLSYLKSLCKDEQSYNDVKNIIASLQNSNENEVIKQLKTGFNNFFWFIRNAETNEFIFYSDSIEQITGYSYAELITMPGGMLSLIHDEDLQKVKHIFAMLSENNSTNSIEFEYRSIAKNGRTLWLSSSIKVEKDTQNNIVNYKGIAFDITNFKEKELELKREAERLVELNSAKDRFISIVSHDLRTPFTSLLGFSEILMQDPELTEHERNEYLEYIHSASKTQLQMINYLLDWSKLQTGKLNIDPTRVNLKNLISNCISVLTGAVIRKNLEMNSEVHENLFINADERLISQSITNLLSNSIKFTPEGKKITVTADIFKKGMVEIVVKDEGRGISEANQAKLFKIDKKFSLEGTNGEKGSGLGLTLVKEIVEKHSGNIWFYSKEGDGSEFHITIPEAKNVVLIVDDNPKNIEKYSKIIKASLKGFEITQASNGYEAISSLSHKLPSILITEHNLPLMNGTQLVETVRKKFADHAIPVIITATELSEIDEERYSSLSVDKIMLKPISEKSLIAQLEELV